MTGWTDSLLPASLGGVPFLVKATELGFGRRVAWFTYPGRDLPDAEDLGARNRAHKIEAVLLGDDALAQAAALEAVLARPGPMVLTHPVYGDIDVAQSGAARSRVNLNYGRVVEIGFEVTEVPPPASPQAPTGTEDTTGDLVSAAAGLLADIGTAVSSVLSFGADMLTTAADVLGQGLAAALGTAAQAAGLLSLAPGLGATLLGADAVLAAAVLTGPAGFTAAVLGLLGAFGTAGAAAVSSPAAASIGTPSWTLWPVPQTEAASAWQPASAGQYPASLPALDALLAIAGWGAALAPVPLITTTRQTQATNQAALVLLAQAGSVAQAATLMPLVAWGSRDQAVGYRDSAVAVIDSVSDQVGAQTTNIPLWDAVYADLAATRAALVAEIGAVAATLPSLSPLTLPATLPADLVAYGLDGDSLDTLFDRGADIATRNGVANPAFVPGGVTLEVLNDVAA